MAKLVIAIMRDRPMPGPGRSGKGRVDVPMEKRVQYAIDCIEGETPEKDQATAFLHKVMDKLEPELKAKAEKALAGAGTAGPQGEMHA